MQKPYVYLVGAGPGDQDLITVKGLKCIEKADVILYDNLANPELLKYRKPGTEIIDVGKSPKHHKYSQDEINALLVKKAQEGNIVTRLKGGDPLVFGRGGEEAIELYKANIPFEIVPGITSAISVPNYAGIPVTHRNVSTSFHVITGHEDPTKEENSVNYEALAQLSGTLIFLMGVGNLGEIRDKLIAHGKDVTTPVALIHRGTTSDQRTVTGSLENIVEVVREKQIKSPSIIIIGDVVNLRPELNWFEKLPLQGRRILVTRTRQQASALARELKEAGAEVIEYPTIEIKEPEDFTEIDKKFTRLKEFDHIIFTSANGVEAFFERLNFLKIDIRHMGQAKIHAVGPSTKKALEDRSIIVDIIPDVYTAEGILEAIDGKIQKGERVLLPRADIARKALTTGLEEMGALAEEMDIYCTITPKYRRAELADLLKKPMDYITFTSSSTVKNFMEILGEENRELIEGSKIAVIGPITKKTAEEYKLDIALEPEKYTVKDLAQKIKEAEK